MTPIDNPEFDLAKLIAPMTVEAMDPAPLVEQYRANADALVEGLREWGYDVDRSDVLGIDEADVMAAATSDAEAALAANRLPDYILPALLEDPSVGTIITVARHLLAFRWPELLPGLDAAVITHDAEGTLDELADLLARGLEEHTVETVVLLLDPT